MIRLFLILLFFLQPVISAEAPFRPFTAKVVKKKVRLRAKPELDAPIVRELVAGDLMVVDGEEGHFLRVRPPSDLKLYLFRTFVLDGAVEGSRVNVRLAPDLEAPIVTQLNTGDRVLGEVSSLHPKWMEIAPPEQVRFFVARDFVEEIGDEGYLARHEKRSEEVRELLSLGDNGRNQLTEPFENISLEEILAPFQKVIAQFAEFKEDVTMAEAAIRDIQQEYLLKKVAYLEGKAVFTLPSIIDITAEAPQEASNSDAVEIASTVPTAPVPQANPRSYWVEVEKKYFNKWRAEKNNLGSEEAFYLAQSKFAEPLRGIIQPYFRPVKHKPGDFVIVDPKTHETLAYIYATKYYLQDYLGQEVEFVGVKRPNNQFAYPAYYVLEIQSCLDGSLPLPSGD
jgi:hypothetical protein